MAKLFKNKFVVTALVIAAIGTLYLRLIKPVINFYFPESVQADIYIPDNIEDLDAALDPVAPTDGSDGDIQFANEQFSLTEIDIGNLRWNERPNRDPFRATKVSESKPRSIEPVFLTSTKPVNIGLPRVSAIVRMPNLKFAVVEGEILKEGDAYGDFVLRSIEEQAVSLIQRPNNLLHRVLVKK